MRVDVIGIFLKLTAGKDECREYSNIPTRRRMSCDESAWWRQSDAGEAGIARNDNDADSDVSKHGEER